MQMSSLSVQICLQTCLISHVSQRNKFRWKKTRPKNGLLPFNQSELPWIWNVTCGWLQYRPGWIAKAQRPWNILCWATTSTRQMKCIFTSGRNLFIFAQLEQGKVWLSKSWDWSQSRLRSIAPSRPDSEEDDKGRQLCLHKRPGKSSRRGCQQGTCPKSPSSSQASTTEPPTHRLLINSEGHTRRKQSRRQDGQSIQWRPEQTTTNNWSRSTGPWYWLRCQHCTTRERTNHGSHQIRGQPLQRTL